ncbi:cytochrome c oxidase subunit 3 [bacterium]|nr:cytochrome c oxidase subunit 3 [bacterium]
MGLSGLRGHAFRRAFSAYSYGRFYHHLEWSQASLQLDWRLGALNTAVLLTSSTVMAFAVEREDNRRPLLLLCALLGLIFLGIKGYEWNQEFLGKKFPTPQFEGSAGQRLFFFFYFTLTGLHAIHLSAGLLAVLFFARSQRSQDEVHLLGLYWHLVDLLWFFLYPLLYLIGSRP